MLNSGYKKAALNDYEKAGEIYKREYESTITYCEVLHNYKQTAVNILKDYEDYMSSLANKPKEIEKSTYEISVRRKQFESELDELYLESKKNEKISKKTAGAGVLAGIGIASYGPTAAMGIATTFGTASTGTPIAILAGAAKTKAALAWLGGGTLAAGGGGIAAGETLLALAGPAGWAIGGTALLGSGLMANSKNKKIAEEAKKKTKEIRSETNKVKKIKVKICAEKDAIKSLNDGIDFLLNGFKFYECRDYNQFSNHEKDKLIQMINSAESLSKRIGVKIS